MSRLAAFLSEDVEMEEMKGDEADVDEDSKMLEVDEDSKMLEVDEDKGNHLNTPELNISKCILENMINGKSPRLISSSFSATDESELMASLHSAHFSPLHIFSLPLVHRQWNFRQPKVASIIHRMEALESQWERFDFAGCVRNLMLTKRPPPIIVADIFDCARWEILVRVFGYLSEHESMPEVVRFLKGILSLLQRILDQHRETTWYLYTQTVRDVLMVAVDRILQEQLFISKLRAQLTDVVQEKMLDPNDDEPLHAIAALLGVMVSDWDNLNVYRLKNPVHGIEIFQDCKRWLEGEAEENDLVVAVTELDDTTSGRGWDEFVASSNEALLPASTAIIRSGAPAPDRFFIFFVEHCVRNRLSLWALIVDGGHRAIRFWQCIDKFVRVAVLSEDMGEILVLLNLSPVDYIRSPCFSAALCYPLSQDIQAAEDKPLDEVKTETHLHAWGNRFFGLFSLLFFIFMFFFFYFFLICFFFVFHFQRERCLHDTLFLPGMCRMANIPCCFKWCSPFGESPHVVGFEVLSNRK